MFCLSRPTTTERRFFDTEADAIAAAVREDPAARRLVWWDSFPYERYNVGRVA